MHWIWKVLLISAGLLVGREVYLALGPRRWNRRTLYTQAAERARALGKPLIVVGNPDGGLVTRLFGRDYGCGDLCLDVDGCPACDNYVAGSIEYVLPQLPNNAGVVYVSCTLEYVSRIRDMLFELDRISGGHLFIVTVEPTSIAAWLYPGAQQRFFTAPPTSPYVHYKQLPWYGGQEERVLLPNTQRLLVNQVQSARELRERAEQSQAQAQQPQGRVIDVEGGETT